MSYFRKIYVVRDKNTPKSEPKPKREGPNRTWGIIRKRVRQLFLLLGLFLLFGLGLGIGFLENKQADEVFEDTALGDFFSEYEPIQFKSGNPTVEYQEPSVKALYSDHFLKDWQQIARNVKKIISTHHFSCRRGCRNITNQEVKETISNGSLVSFEDPKTDRTYDTGVYRVQHYTVSKRLLTICFSIAKDHKSIKLITGFDKGKHSCPDECGPIEF